MDSNEQHADGIKKSIDDIIGVDTFLKRKKKTEDDQQRERFIKIIFRPIFDFTGMPNRSLILESKLTFLVDSKRVSRSRINF